MTSDEHENDKPVTEVTTPGDKVADEKVPVGELEEPSELGSDEEPPTDGDDALDEEDDGPNFTPLQRQFLWTITAVIALSVLLAAGINIGYQEMQHSRAQATARAEDDYQKIKDRFEQLRQRDVAVLTAEYQHKDKEAFDQTMNELLDTLRQERTAFVAMRRQEGFDENEPPETYYDDMGKFILQRVASQAGVTTTRPAGTLGPVAPGSASTQPASTQPVTSAPATTEPGK